MTAGDKNTSFHLAPSVPGSSARCFAPAEELRGEQAAAFASGAAFLLLCFIPPPGHLSLAGNSRLGGQGPEHFLSQESAQGWVSLTAFSFPSSQDSARAEKASQGGRALPHSRSRPALTGTMETPG